ncbi:MAG: Dihydroorotate dehydrogenase B (NAD(+)), catalytic subunit [Candidatus Methanoperedenaceae archaeon GB50]|nr:Dihydroorotate dehydrogenase B (NAD(+)), catalytic subunit [Candidatus Methanoperedenaceae archaeon GB50]CAD7782744.1 MAG: Dihydroorotate dehydrogenase B (NAD(+)), catalytic subunit [Candidatus Methanoperedenaceae archaeon GB50]
MGKINLGVKVGRLELKNPVLVASGTFGYGEEYAPLIDLNQLGGIVVKSTSLKPKIGNPPPRLAEVSCGLLNAIGLENIGVEQFIQEKLPFLKKFDTKIIVNIFGFSIDEYAALAEILDTTGIDALEVNVSCPNIKTGGEVFATDPKMVAQITQAVCQRTHLPVFVKLSPQVTDIVAIAKAAMDAGADGVSLINSFPAMGVDVFTRKPKLGNITGGLSGPCLKPIALKMVWDIVRNSNIPVIGIGGITNFEDALEYLIVGAKAIQIGSANFLNPQVSIEVIKGIKAYLERHEIKDINMIIGSLKT